MADYLLTEYAASLDSAEVERAGDVLFNAKDEDRARKAYELALSKLRKGD
jgi:predicted negative regulator of RcsB-dependent stress response